ncbi:hypothetical protein H6F77_08805 [Microcoleus sp. FACHB-831]|uniref:hypothetical protein n=1 Tax=Microcoleus sp. FACHB-831 TaxID=2692827 RepID=UPI00168413F6|nr:hypothetical protein [Microcoleus sp. FACHB-831]MBD1921190.1 hypothetical protein [Microcoleus sp. FACHB-831]
MLDILRKSTALILRFPETSPAILQVRSRWPFKIDPACEALAIGIAHGKSGEALNQRLSKGIQGQKHNLLAIFLSSHLENSTEKVLSTATLAKKKLRTRG